MAKPNNTPQANVNGPARTPSADGIAQAARAAAGRRGPPPVHLWNPPFCGDLDICIRRDGSWHYLGTPIGREALVRLFASILRREDDRFFLVTPAEKVGITVEDAPFVAVDVDAKVCSMAPADAGMANDAGGTPGTPATGADADDTAALSCLRFVTNVGDHVTAGPQNPIRVLRQPDGVVIPYLEVRRGLEARIDRKTFYRLVDLGQIAPGPDGAAWFGLRSMGTFFPLLPADQMG
jgi:hypothetical protein